LPHNTLPAFYLPACLPPAQVCLLVYCLHCCVHRSLAAACRFCTTGFSYWFPAGSAWFDACTMPFLHLRSACWFLLLCVLRRFIFVLDAFVGSIYAVSGSGLPASLHRRLRLPAGYAPACHHLPRLCVPHRHAALLRFYLPFSTCTCLRFLLVSPFSGLPLTTLRFLPACLPACLPAVLPFWFLCCCLPPACRGCIPPDSALDYLRAWIAVSLCTCIPAVLSSACGSTPYTSAPYSFSWFSGFACLPPASAFYYTLPPLLFCCRRRHTNGSACLWTTPAVLLLRLPHWFALLLSSACCCVLPFCLPHRRLPRRSCVDFLHLVTCLVLVLRFSGFGFLPPPACRRSALFSRLHCAAVFCTACCYWFLSLRSYRWFCCHLAYSFWITWISICWFCLTCRAVLLHCLRSACLLVSSCLPGLLLCGSACTVLPAACLGFCWISLPLLPACHLHRLDYTLHCVIFCSFTAFLPAACLPFSFCLRFCCVTSATCLHRSLFLSALDQFLRAVGSAAVGSCKTLPCHAGTPAAPPPPRFWSTCLMPAWVSLHRSSSQRRLPACACGFLPARVPLWMPFPFLPAACLLG